MMYQAIDIEVETTNLNPSMTRNKLLFINLADDGDMGEKSTRALRKNSNNDVTCIQLLLFAKHYQQTNGINCILPPELLAIDLNTYDELIIGIHGFKDNRMSAYYLEHQEERQYLPLFDANQFAEFIQFILAQKNYHREKKLLVTLSMCYGGRIDDYELCYQNNLMPKVFKHSFAYQVIVNFDASYNIELAAYTGAVGFDATNNGKLWCETEKQISIKLDIEKLRAEKQTIELDSDENDDNEKKYFAILKQLKKLELYVSDRYHDHGEIRFTRDCLTKKIVIDLSKRLPMTTDEPNLEYNSDSESDIETDSELTPGCTTGCVSFNR